MGEYLLFALPCQLSRNANEQSCSVHFAESAAFAACSYTTFQYELTPHLNRDGNNTITVRIANLGRNSRYYSGSGIYRHTWLTVVDAVHVPLWGASVTTPEVASLWR